MAPRIDGRSLGAGSGFVYRELTTQLASVVVREVDQELGSYMGRWAKEFNRSLSGRGRTSFREVNRRVADRANHRISTAYAGISFPNSGYRTGDARPGKENRLSGKLGPALKRIKITQGDADGITFLPIKKLDRAAAHWFRINFGTDGRTESSPDRPSHAAFFSNRKGFDLTRYQGQGGLIRSPKRRWMVFSANSFVTSKVAGPFSPGGAKGYISYRGQRGAGIRVRPGTIFSQFEGHHFIERGASYLTQIWPEEISGAALVMAIEAKSRARK